MRLDLGNWSGRHLPPAPNYNGTRAANYILTTIYGFTKWGEGGRREDTSDWLYITQVLVTLKPYTHILPHTVKALWLTTSIDRPLPYINHFIWVPTDLLIDCVLVKSFSYMSVYMRRSFPKGVKLIQKLMLQCQYQVWRSCFEMEFFINMYISTDMYICVKLFTKTQSLNLALSLQAHFLEWNLTPFGGKKALHMYIIMKSSFFKPWSLNLAALSLETQFADWYLSRFGKELFIYFPNHRNKLNPYMCVSLLTTCYLMLKTTLVWI